MGFIMQLYEAEIKHHSFKMILQANYKKHEAKVEILATTFK